MVGGPCGGVAAAATDVDGSCRESDSVSRSPPRQFESAQVYLKMISDQRSAIQPLGVGAPPGPNRQPHNNTTD